MNIKISISDYTNYDPRRCNNGGAYGFVESATVQGGQIASGFYWTTADFAYCPCCGRFEQRLRDHIAQWHGGDESDYQPSAAMGHALLLALHHSPDRAVELFQQRKDGLELAIDVLVPA